MMGVDKGRKKINNKDQATSNAVYFRTWNLATLTFTPRGKNPKKKRRTLFTSLNKLQCGGFQQSDKGKTNVRERRRPGEGGAEVGGSLQLGDGSGTGGGAGDDAGRLDGLRRGRRRDVGGIGVGSS